VIKREPKKPLYRLIFLIGWLLSPFTFWNDAFVNIPLSYICADIFIRFFPADFLVTVVAFYWLSNALGILIMLASGRYIILGRKQLLREALNLLLTIGIYTVLVIILHNLGILRPLKLSYKKVSKISLAYPKFFHYNIFPQKIRNYG